MNRLAKNLISLIIGTVVLSLTAPAALADWEPEPSDEKQVKAGEILARMREKMPQLDPYFEQAYGYAIIPGITRIGIGFGGAYGRGVVIEQDEAIGRTSFAQFTSGIQLGAKYFSMIIFFKDMEALEAYKLSKVQFLGQIGIDLATVGVSGTPSYNEGVALFAMTRLGLMGEFTISGARFKYWSLEANGTNQETP